jgi:DNA-binding transcriptional MerR regulator
VDLLRYIRLAQTLGFTLAEIEADLPRWRARRRSHRAAAAQRWNASWPISTSASTVCKCCAAN